MIPCGCGDCCDFAADMKHESQMMDLEPADAGAAERLVEEEAMEQKRTDFNILVHMITGAGIPCEWTSKTIFIGPPGDHQIQIAFDEHGKLIDIFTE